MGPLFFQLFEKESSTFTYLLGDPEAREAVLIDSVLETVDRDLDLINAHNLKLKYILDTHVHADHITGAAVLKKQTGAQTVISSASGILQADVLLNDGDVLNFGKYSLRALSTPGHTDSCMSFVFENKVFTGDSLLIHGNGRTDFQQGSSSKLFDSIHNKLFTLPDSTEVYPAHDYQGRTSSTISEEKNLNPGLALGKTKSEFCEYQAQKRLALPKKIHIAVPANLAGGLFKK